MTTPRRPSAAQRRASAEASAAPAPEAPADAAPPADAPDDAPPEAPDAGADVATTGDADGESPGVLDRAKAAVGGAVDALLGGDDGDDAEDEAALPEEPSSDSEHTCVHPSCEDPAIPAGEEYFMATQGPAQGPMHHSCSHKTIPIRR